RNYLKLAQQVENQFPELEARLMTAVQQEPSLPEGHYGFLKQKVIRETLAHGRKQPWNNILSRRRIAITHCSHAFAATCFLGTMLLWTQVPVETAGQTAASNSQEEPVTPYTCSVNPGDTEVEQGSGLLITARFADRLPGKSTLLVTDPEGNQKRVPMTRSLDDPLFGGHLDVINQNLTYQVEFAGETTKPFQVHVFQYPTLTRADASLTFPSYTGMASKLVEDTHSVSAVEGSQLEWICHLNKTIAKAYLESKTGDVLPMKPHPDNPQQYHATITLTQSQRWKLHLEDQQGRTNQLPPELVAQVTRNQPPKLKLASAKDSRVSPLEEMTVEANVWDDYGLAK
ncbi:MAG: hypothetical protein GY888_06100, partial [Planctomycetaceae bacterium]|nr:hypothetical protein [Planctomycetaceae bacterium]